MEYLIVGASIYLMCWLCSPDHETTFKAWLIMCAITAFMGAIQ